MTVDRWREALRAVAERWTDPEHSSRSDAVHALLAGGHRFTEEGVAFSLNHAASVLAGEAFYAWLGDIGEAAGITLGAISRERSPVAALFEAAAASLSGAEVHIGDGSVATDILASFFEEVEAEAGHGRVLISSERTMLDFVDSVIAMGSAHDRAQWDAALDHADIPVSRRHIPTPRTGVAVVNGSEDHAQLSGLAEDLLLHDGQTTYNVRVVLAPEGQPPDPLLSALAGFREVFPPHPATDGSLAMTVAFLEAMKSPLAVGPGFLLSRGEFEPQEGAHLRWTEYRSVQDAVALFAQRSAGELFIVAASETAGDLRSAGLPEELLLLDFGDAHRPAPGQPPLTSELAAFLRGLGDASSS